MKLFFPLSFIIIAIALFFFVVNPLYTEVGTLRADVSTYNLALDNSKELQKKQDALLDSYKNISQEDRDRLDHFLPNTVNNIKFILEVEQIANLHNLPIKDIKFDPDKADTAAIKAAAAASGANVIAANDPLASRPYGVFPIEFSIDGSYPTFVAFLKDLEHNLRLVDIKSISFTVPPPNAKPGVGPDPSIFTYTLKVETYWLK